VTPEEAEEYTQSLGQIGGGLWRQILWAERQRVPAALGLSLRDWVDDRLGGYVRLAIEERKQAVRELTAPTDEGGEGLTQREAAEITGLGLGTVNRLLHEDDEPVPNGTLEESEANESGGEDDEPVPNGTLELPAEESDRAEVVAELASQSQPEPVTETPQFPEGPYPCIVIDPPWPMRKIERSVRPWQGVELDYPVMTLEEIQALPIADIAATDAHLYLWVTHKFLPDGLRLLDAWGFKYQCVMTWNKNTGIVPYSWMYDTEHVLFGTRGNLKVSKKGQRLSFDEPVSGHSIKPAVFYDRVRNASPEPRLDMFPGVQHEGFTAWGLEASHRGC
jgi:N6-adenosine-specific RNA methylase IME4